MSRGPENTFIASIHRHLDLKEIWKPFPDDSRFQVSSLGRVKFKDKPPKNIKPRKNGRLYVCAYNGGKVQYAVHRMVLLAFRGRPPVGHTASHLDGNPQNNRLSNLVWEDHGANCMRKREHGTDQSGERNGWSKLTEEQVRFIRSSKLASRKIAPLVGISDAYVRTLRQGKAWRHVET